jgi:O-antigen biosynthesis protein
MTLGQAAVGEGRVAASASVIAFYLPQYHQIPENDLWWGEGFTDWVNVRRAKALFDGHNQPRLPATLGYYDLRTLEVHHAQAALARSHGIAAFCYYAYWFRGRRLLEQPLDLVAANPDLAMPYAICWANETWSRRWDGSEHEILLEQRHSPEGDVAFVDGIANHLADPRYVRVEGRPLLLLYRPGLLSDPLRTTDALRERAVQLGLGEVFLAMVQSFGHWEPVSYGFDAAVEFPPHNLGIDAVSAVPRIPMPSGGSGVRAESFADVIRICLSRPAPKFRWFRGLMPDWDNTPRRGANGTVFLGASPTIFRRWLEAALEWTYLFRRPGERLIFVNAWNEWAEGAYLEPDVAHGTAYLEAVNEALLATSTLAAETASILAKDPNSRLLDIARAQWTGRRSFEADAMAAG